jgi:hypothetical protein
MQLTKNGKGDGTHGNLRVGKPDVKRDAAAHVRGVKQGNEGVMRQKPDGALSAEATDRRSTGIWPEGHAPIDPRMPKLTPA